MEILKKYILKCEQNVMFSDNLQHINNEMKKYYSLHFFLPNYDLSASFIIN